MFPLPPIRQNENHQHLSPQLYLNYTPAIPQLYPNYMSIRQNENHQHLSSQPQLYFNIT